MVAKKNTAPVAAAASPAPVVPSAPAPAKDVKAAAKPATAPAAAAKPAAVAPAKAEAKPAKAAAPAKTAAAPATPAAETVAPVEVENPLDTVFAKLTAATALFKEIQATLKVLQKSYDRMKKVVEKQEKKKANARTTPSGFAKPTKISDELCAFLGVPKGTEMSRTDVTRKINLYVKEHNLYDPKNRRIINPDASMKKILTLKAGEDLSFFTLQRAIKGHFAPTVKA
jgi:chromatin remodeling complex protein RSC6